jgi:hypothetical protein
MILDSIFKALQEQIKAQMPEIKHIDIYNGQLENEKAGKGEPWLRPAVFFRFQPHPMRNLGNKVQDAEIDLFVMVVTEIKARTATRHIGVQQNRALEHFTLNGKLHKALHTFAAPDAGLMTLSRVRVDPIEGVPGYQVTAQTFKGRIVDTTAQEVYTLANPQPDLVISSVELL